MSPTVIYSSEGKKTNCEGVLKSGGLEVVSTFVHRLVTDDAVIVAEYPDKRKYVLTAAGDNEVYIEAYDGGIDGKIVSREQASEFLHNLLGEEARLGR